MGTVVTIMNMKGGVGKTTVAMHLGGVISRYKFPDKRRKVLLVDYDPQFNLSQAFIDKNDKSISHAARASGVHSGLGLEITDGFSLSRFRGPRPKNLTSK